MSDLLAEHEAMSREHAAWLDLMAELRRHGEQTLVEGAVSRQTIDLNGPKAKPLMDALRKWGEELVALRSGQDDALRERVLDEVRREYPGQYERGTYPES